MKSAHRMDVSPNVHEIFTVLNGGDFGVIVDASCGVVRVTDDFMYRIRPVIHDHRAFLVLSVDMLARKVAVLLRSASDFVQPDAFNAFSVAASRIATNYDPMRVLPVVVSCVRPNGEAVEGAEVVGLADVDPPFRVPRFEHGTRSVDAVADREPGVVGAGAVARGVVNYGDQLEGDGEVESAVWRGEGEGARVGYRRGDGIVCSSEPEAHNVAA